jgi:hypothetical protein
MAVCTDIVALAALLYTLPALTTEVQLSLVAQLTFNTADPYQVVVGGCATCAADQVCVVLPHVCRCVFSRSSADVAT